MICPAEAAALQAANTLRAMKALGHEALRDTETAAWDFADFPAVREMTCDPAAPSCEEAKAQLYKKLRSICSTASGLRARSAKGAMFQAYLGAEIGCSITGYIPTRSIDEPALGTAQDAEDEASRLLYSAISGMEKALRLDQDQDLKILRQWFLDPARDNMEALSGVTESQAPPKSDSRAAERHAQDKACLAEAAAIQAASILRTMKALGHEDLRDPETVDLRREDFPLVLQLEEDGVGQRAEWAERTLFRQLRALGNATALLKATSVKGAIFQAYLGANIGSTISGNITSNTTKPQDITAMELEEDKVTTLFGSALDAIEAAFGADADLQILRQWFLNPATDSRRLISAIMQKAAA